MPGLCYCCLRRPCSQVASPTPHSSIPGTGPARSRSNRPAAPWPSSSCRPTPAPRRAAEDQLQYANSVRTRIKAVAAESIFEANQVGSARAMQGRFGVCRHPGTVLTMRVLGERAALATGPPPYEQYPPRLDYLQLSQYWGYGWGRVYVAGYLLTDSVVAVETLVYSLPRDELLWASRSRQVHKYQIPSLIDELGDAVPKDMSRVGLLPQNARTAIARQ